jgi:MFS family permease
MQQEPPCPVDARFRPRHLYFTVFLWISVTGGRFLAPFLEHEGNLSGTAIGALLAVQQAVGVPAASMAGAWADRVERQYPGRGRATVLASGIALGSLLFLLHALSRCGVQHSFFASFAWYFGLRVLYAVAVSMVFPVMDGMCLDFLNRVSTKDDFGKERLYGAISWAIAHLTMAPLLDKYGFVILYPMGALAAVTTVFTIYLYSQDCVHVQRQLRKRHSEVIIESEEEDPLDATVTEKEEERIPTVTLFRLLIATSYGIAFLLAVFTLASGQAVVDSLSFLFFEFLGSSYSIMGFTVVLTVAFEIPIFHIAPRLLQRFGAASLLQTAAACYIVRVIGYTLLPTGHIAYVFLLEPLHGVTYACSTMATVDFVSQLMPAGYEASGQGFVYQIGGAGSVVGLLLGGWAEDTLGPRIMYRVAACVVLVGCAAFGCTMARGGDYGRHHIVLSHDVELTEQSAEESSDEEANDVALCP